MTKSVFLLFSPYSSVLEAAMVGAVDSLPVVGAIAANIIAFLAMYQFFNNVLGWLGDRLLISPTLTFEVSFVGPI